MLRFFLVSIATVLITTVSSLAYAADSESATNTGTTDTSSGVTAPALLLDTVVAKDIKSIALTFNQPIRIDSIRVRIIDQATNESIRVSSITGSTTSDSVAIITTTANLTSGTSYVITITSALSMTDMTIKTGVDSIREFIAPITPTATPTTLSAPPNPSAVMVATGETTVAPPVAAVATGTTEVAPKNIDVALPATGAPTVILILLAGLSAFMLLIFRKKA